MPETTEAQNLERALCEKLCARVRLYPDSERAGRFLLDTPFAFPDGDHYQIYLSEIPSGGFRLSDLGHTLMHVSYENDVDNLFKGTRAVLFDRIFAELGIKREGGEVFVETSIDGASDAIFRLGQAFTRIYDLASVSSPRASSFDRELYDEINQIVVDENRITENYIVPDLLEASNYPVDYRINGGAGAPLFLYGVVNRDKARLTTICLSHFIRHSVRHKSLLVFQDQQKIPPVDLARLSDVGGQMVSSLSKRDLLRRKVEELAGLSA